MPIISKNLARAGDWGVSSTPRDREEYAPIQARDRLRVETALIGLPVQRLLQLVEHAVQVFVSAALLVDFRY
jgi:hypothetical protein